jgi:HEAT repeat protein
MTKRKDIQNERLAEIAIDPDVLAKELSVELEIDPLEQIDKDGFSRGTLDKNLECDEALKLLKGDREQRIQGLRIFCEYRDKRSFPLLLPLLDQPCPVERMSAVYALGRNPFPSAVEKLVSLLETDDNAYVRRATAWSLANYDNEIVLKPLINSLKNDVASVRLWSSSSLAEIGSTSSFNAQLAAEQLLISLKIDNEPVVRSNCIWSLCRLFEKLNEISQESFVDECTKIALFDKEPSVMEEAKTALDSMGMKGFYK